MNNCTASHNYPVLVPTTGSLSLLVRDTLPVIISRRAIFFQCLLSQSFPMLDSCRSTNLNSPDEILPADKTDPDTHK